MQYGAIFESKTRPITQGVKFDTRLKIKNLRGEVIYGDSSVEIKNVKTVIFYLACKTSFYTHDFSKENTAHVNWVYQKSYENILARHIEDYKRLYGLARINIDHPISNEPTDIRLSHVKNGQTDIGLEEMLFNYGHYMLIASSRPGSNPANLQGIWNDKIEAAWNADYYLNINLQMNYWPADVTNLGELNKPLFYFLDRAVETVKSAVKENYGFSGTVFRMQPICGRQLG